MKNELEKLEYLENKVNMKKMNNLDTTTENQEMLDIMTDIYTQSEAILGSSSTNNELRSKTIKAIIENKLGNDDIVLLPAADMEKKTPLLQHFFHCICAAYSELRKCLLDNRRDKECYDKLFLMQEVFDIFYQDYYSLAMVFTGTEVTDIPEHDYSSRDYTYEPKEMDFEEFIRCMDDTIDRFQLNIDQYMKFFQEKKYNECKDTLMTMFFLDFDLFHLIVSVHEKSWT